MKVLIIDDEKLIVDDLRNDVSSLYPEASIDGFVSATEALEQAKHTEYDVALLDIDMPGMDGLTLARKLIALWPAVNIIFVTGHNEYSMEAHELYCSSFLLKPVGQRKLKKAFENLRKPFVDLPNDFYTMEYSGNDIIGKSIESFRNQRGLSRNEVADLMGVTRQTVFRWEHGERLPDILTFIRLMRILGMEMKDILTLKPEGGDENQE